MAKAPKKKTTRKARKSDRLAAAGITAKLPGTGTDLVPVDEKGWAINGELALNCSCDLFCPCVVSLGAAAPTHGYCQAWVGIRIDSGHKDGVPLGGLNVAMLLDIPGRMGEGGWKVGLYVDERANAAQVTALEMILSGQAGGTTGLFRLLVAEFLGTQRVPVDYETEGDIRHLRAGKAILASIQPIVGAKKGEPVTIENTSYWMGPTVIVAKGLKSKLRDFGRVWSFDECSAELCPIAWRG
ncbi:MAG: DUF1326 domain-containing protein [Pseudomonadota bacterium]